MLIQKRLDLNPDQQEVLPSAPWEELLYAFTKPSSYNQSETNNLDYKGESSSPLLTTINARRQGQNNKIQKELKGLKRKVTSLLHRLETSNPRLLSEEEFFSYRNNWFRSSYGTEHSKTKVDT